jgi:hypothetical protein
MKYIETWFSVPQRVVHLGLEPTPELTWAAGAKVRDSWMELTGLEPARALRKKTSGTGSHVFAVYPPDFIEQADSIIMKVAEEVEADAAKQTSLFDHIEMQSSASEGGSSA